MTKLVARWDPALKAFVPEASADLSDLAADTRATVEFDRADEANDTDNDLPPLPPFPKDAGYTITGGPGMTGKEFAAHARKVNADFGQTAFPEPEDSVTLARKLRESGR